MTPYYEQSGVTLYYGNCVEVLQTIPSESVNCCVTSPPYWGLRDYGTALWEGGDPACDHSPRRGHHGEKQASSEGTSRDKMTGGNCPKCGARRIDEQIGLEATPELYTQAIVQVCRGVGRVLRDDGTLWLNLGDSYAAGGGKQVVQTKNASHGLDGIRQITPGFASKQLIGIPWRVAFALQSAGWYLRCDIIWAKQNPMPESVEDRPTRSHEYIFLLSKQANYYYDHEAIKEPAVSGHPSGNGFKRESRLSFCDENGPRGSDEPWKPQQPKSWNGSTFDGMRDLAVRPTTGRRPREAKVHGNLPGRSDEGAACNKPWQETRNKRDVWTINSEPFPEAHFATFPPALILPCVLAGCPTGGIVVDPFSGAGTTALVAKENGRRAIGIDLNQEYLEMSVRRLGQDVFAF